METGEKHICAVIWDYDCTLADTWYKNLMVTRKIIEDITGRDPTKISALRSLEHYRVAATRSMHWRRFYRHECGLSEEQTEQAGRVWTEFQLRDETPVQFFDGIAAVLATLNHISHGIVSQNSKQSITRALQQEKLWEHFECIIGYEEVDFDKQKPEPDGLLLCIEQVNGRTPGYIFYIGDHQVDMTCVFNANRVLQQRGHAIQVVSIGAFYGCDRDETDWLVKPDYKAHAVRDIIRIVQSL